MGTVTLVLVYSIQRTDIQTLWYYSTSIMNIFLAVLTDEFLYKDITAKNITVPK